MICDQIFLQICPLAEDLSVIRTDFKCTEEGCDSYFKSTSNLEMHLIKRHNKESYFLQKKMENISFQYFCPEKTCKYSLLPEKKPNQLRWFPKLKYLKQHYFKVHKERTVECEECGKKFSSSALKNQHRRTQCGRTFSCGTCSLTYGNSGSLFMHCKRKGHIIKDDVWPPPKTPKAVGTSPPASEGVRRERKILPKPDPDSSVDIAAAALSELSQKVIVKGVDKGVQTTGRRRVQVKQPKKKSSTETQTDSKQQRISSETQTTGFYSSKGKQRRNRRKSMQTQTKQTPAKLGEKLLFPGLVDHLGDIVLSELWASRNSSSTQTAEAAPPVSLDLFTENDSDSITEEQISRLIQQNTIFDYGRMCDIETQTTVNDSSDDFMDDCPIFLNTETQTIQNAIDEYSHNCTQTCDDILLTDFVEFSDIETQTAWAYLRDSEFPLVSAETQTAS